MEKISGIIPASSRVTTVDMKASGVARPGTPSFGREVGVSHLAPKNEMNASARAQEELGQQMSLRQPNKNDAKADIVQSLADKFFIRKAQQNDDMPDFRAEGAEEEEMNIASQQISRVRNDLPVKTTLRVESAGSPAEMGEQSAVGHYLDVRA